MRLKGLNDIDVAGKRVFCRVDFNVPLDENQRITDSSRIDLTLPTIRHLLNAGAKKIILASHLGRPKGQPNPKLSLEPIAAYLADKLALEVFLTSSATDGGVQELLSLKQSQIILLENIRFHPEEEKNDREFAQKLSQYADFYVNDAFGAAHRKHASTHAINAFFKHRAAAGLLVEKEIQALNRIIDKPEKPFIAVIGGAKISDKIKTIERLISQVDYMLIGGAMAYPFLVAKGAKVGQSLCNDEDVKLAKKILAQRNAIKLLLPIDHVVANSIDAQETQVVEFIPDDMMALDIGPRSLEAYSSKLATAKTVLWNGPMGLFEKEPFAKGTFELANCLSNLEAYTLVGGGDSVAAVNRSGLASYISHVSTGGGASLEYIEQGSLPGIDALKYGVN